MAYGLDLSGQRRRAPVRSWRQLDQERRLAIVDRTLGRAPREDLGDGYPAAL